MGTNSKIEWTDATWGPVTGCTPVSPGCQNCYAKALAKRFPQIHGGWDDFSVVHYHTDRLKIPMHWKKPRRIFVCSMGDLFHDAVPFEFIDKVFAVMALCPQHTFMLLTKRPERMKEYYDERPGYHRRHRIAHQMFSKNGFRLVPNGLTEEQIETAKKIDNGNIWPIANIWFGVTAESQQQADERIPVLLDIPAAVRFVSIEPMIGPVDLSGYFGTAINGMAEVAHEYTYNAGINWVICGGENGPGARPMHPDWAYVLRDQCQGAGVPFFFKGFGAWTPISTDRYEADGHLRFRGKKYPIRRIDSEGRDITNLDGLHNNETDSLVINVGKKQAGRMLDGTEFNQFPKRKETK